jgi:ferredoxin
MDNDEGACQFKNLCERLGTCIESCSTAAVSKYKVLEQMRHTYNGDVQLARIALIEQDIDRVRACLTTVIKLLS